mgnify:CR=1 FL=1
MSTIEIRVPDIGDFDAVEIIEVLVSEGDSVEANQDIMTLESDKAAMEIPSSHAGTVAKLNVAVGDKVKEGDLILTLEVADAETTVKEQVSREQDKPTPAPIATVAETDSAMSVVEITVPYIGDFDAVEIIEVLVSEGDSVDANQDIITLESDKAAMEIPSPHAGTVSKLNVAVGDKVKEGDLILTLEVAGADNTTTELSLIHI